MTENKVVLITGAARNIGLAIAKRFAKEGYDVCITSRDQQSADKAALEVQNEFPKITSVGYGMLTNELDQIKETFKKVREKFGRIDALIANAADPGYNQSILSTTPEQFDHVIGSNAKGYFFCSQEAAKLMIDTNIKGSIVLIGSVHSKRALPNRIVYAASKGAIEVMNRNMCYELGKFGIRSNLIIVGAVYNDRWVNYTEEDYEKKRANWPLGMESYPDDIANAAYFLSSDQANTISGSELTVDSGVMSVLLSYNKNWDMEKDEREKLVK
ncbi:MAG: SDR family oxidoreductase [Ruminococcaceae bacterium]|nr:SDR family oxidoreductase [Oscillospiraceae bacterium]